MYYLLRNTEVLPSPILLCVIYKNLVCGDCLKILGEQRISRFKEDLHSKEALRGKIMNIVLFEKKKCCYLYQERQPGDKFRN